MAGSKQTKSNTSHSTL